MLQTSNKSASYFLAQQHELNNNINDAIDFYSRAGRYNHAVRLGMFDIYIYRSFPSFHNNISTTLMCFICINFIEKFNYLYLK